MVVIVPKARTQTASLDRQKSARVDSSRGGRSVSEIFESFVPSRGALIDIYGPGTVFHMIREREIRRKNRGLANKTPTAFSTTSKTFNIVVSRDSVYVT